jgi:methionyl-tRNA formyltransferase
LTINYPKKLKKKIFKTPKYGAANVHFGLLPKYRGRSPVALAILNNDKKFTCTIHKINEKLDNGTTILTKSFSVNNYDIIKIYKNYFFKSYDLIILSVEKIFSKKLIPIKKNNGKYNKKLSFLKNIKLYLKCNLSFFL